MHVLHGQQFLAAFREPLITSVGLALGTVPGAARVERDGLMATFATAIPVSPERRRTAVLDGKQHAHVQPVNQDRFFSIKLLPCVRMISATSKSGRLIACAASGTVSPGRGSIILPGRAVCRPPAD